MKFGDEYMINGNIDGVKNFILKKLETIYDVRFEKSNILTEELAELLREVTLELEREVSVAIDRKGSVVSVAVGDSSTVEVPMIDTREGRLSQVRVIHTHPNGNPKLSALDISALLKLKLDCIVAIGVSQDKPLIYNIGFCDVENNVLIEEEIEDLTIDKVLSYKFLDKVKYIEDIFKVDNIMEDNSERAILVSIEDEESPQEQM